MKDRLHPSAEGKREAPPVAKVPALALARPVVPFPFLRRAA